MAEPLPESPPLSPPGGDTPPDAWDETLGRAIDVGWLDPELAATDARLAGAFAAHQKLESLFALLRGEADGDNGPLSLRTRERVPGVRVRADGIADGPPPTRLGRYIIVRAGSPDRAPEGADCHAMEGSPEPVILGAGAFGTVYLARDPELNRHVAIKVSRAGAFTSAGALDKFRTEARHAASLNHPQIVTIHDVGREAQQVYIVMEYVPGRTLAQVIEEGPVAPVRAAEVLATVADALHFAHKKGFAHRDLKPANILLDEPRGADTAVGNALRGVPQTGAAPSVGNALRGVPLGRSKIADFGLAVTDETQRTLAGQVAGALRCRRCLCIGANPVSSSQRGHVLEQSRFSRDPLELGGFVKVD